MKTNPKIIGFVQAAGVSIYVTLLAVTFQFLQARPFVQNLHLDPPVSIIIFLLTFIISALICSASVFAYPIYLFSNSRGGEAAKTVAWTGFWLIIIFVLFVACSVLILA